MSEIQKYGNQNASTLVKGANEGSGDNGIHFSAGPAAVMVGLINLLIQLSMKLQEQDTQMALIETKVQGDVSTASYKAGLEAARLQRDKDVKQAITSGVSAGISFVEAAGVKIQQKLGGFDDAMESAQKSKEGVQGLQELDRDARTQSTDLSLGDADAVATRSANPIREQLLKGQFGSGTEVEHIEAMSTMTGSERAQLRETLERRVSDLSKDINTHATNKSAVGQDYQRLAGFGKEVTNTVTGAMGANDQQAATQQQVNEKNLSSTQQMAGQGHATALENLRKHYDVVASLLSLLRQASAPANG